MRNLPDQACHELNEIPSVVQPFVIDWTAACRVGSSLNAKDWAALLDFKGRSDFGLGWYCVQLVLSLGQRNIVFAFKKRKDRLDLQVVGDDFLADLQREEGLIEGKGNTIREAHTTNSDHALAYRQCELTRHGRIGSHHFFTNHAGRRLAAKSVHVLNKSAQFCELLRDFRRRNECAFAATNLDKTAAHKILNSPANGNAADFKSRDEVIFSRQLVANPEAAIDDLAGEDCFDA
jgi:hypothetical protein